MCEGNTGFCAPCKLSVMLVLFVWSCAICVNSSSDEQETSGSSWLRRRKLALRQSSRSGGKLLGLELYGETSDSSMCSWSEGQ